MQHKELTSFRALAFLAVFFYHTGVSVFNFGYLGVIAFFVLSGFLLTPILFDMKKNLDVRAFFVNFYGRRMLRIFPLYYFYLFSVTLISVAVLLIYGGNDYITSFLNQLPWTLTYTYDFFNVSSYYQHNYWVSHFWSLAVEEQFYLFWPLFIFLVKEKHQKLFLLSIILAGPLLRLFVTMMTAGYGFPILHGDVNSIVYSLPISHIDAFAMGGYFALYQKPKSSHSTWWVIALAVLLGYATNYISIGNIHLTSLGYPALMKDKYIWGYSVVNFVFAFILVQIRGGKFLPWLFENPVIHYLGNISYGLYVYHYPVIWAVESALSSQPKIIQIILALLITILLSAVSYEFMEKRFINLKDKFFSRKPSAGKPANVNVPNFQS